MDELATQCNYGETILDMKALLMKSCSNIFNKYFCFSKRKSFSDPDHNKYCKEFDEQDFELIINIIVKCLTEILQDLLGGEHGAGV